VSIEQLRVRAEAHLYAGETFTDIAEKLMDLMKPVGEHERLAALACRSILIQVGQSELTVAQTLCDIAQAEQAKEAATC
jgi:hypothetical protein